MFERFAWYEEEREWEIKDYRGGKVFHSIMTLKPNFTDNSLNREKRKESVWNLDPHQGETHFQ